MKIIFHGATQDYPTSGFAENVITQGFNIFTQHIMVTYESDITRGQTKITEILDSHKITLHWTTIFVPRTSGLHMKKIAHGDRSRLPNIWIRRKYDFTLGHHNFTQNILITYGNDIPWGQIAITQNMDSWKHDYTGPQCLYPTHGDYIWE